ncbi:MAG: MFS transporter [Chloroflexota bacterium]
MATAQTAIEVSPSLIRRVIITSVVGTGIEWYDFFIYGFFAAWIGRNFFPAADPIAATLSAWAAFAVGLMFRPLGAVLFGIIGDKVGRKTAFMIAIFVMGLGTFIIGILPGYDSIGVAATILVFLLRIAQGVSIGGSWGGGAAFVAEHVPQHRRGYYGSWITGAAPLAVVVAMGLQLLITTGLDKATVDAWAWRIPFWLSLLLVAVALYLRMSLEETPVFGMMKKAGTVSQAPFQETFTRHWRLLLVGILATVGLGAGWYSAYMGVISTLTAVAKVPAASASLIMVISGLVSFVGYILFGGLLADRWGRKPVLMIGYGLAAVTWYPLTMLTRTGDLFLIALIPILLTLWTGFYYGPYGALAPEMYPARIRYTALSIAYHVPVGWLGGFAPYIMLSFASSMNDPIAGAWYPAICCAISFIACGLFLKETKRADIVK